MNLKTQSTKTYTLRSGRCSAATTLLPPLSIIIITIEIPVIIVSVETSAATSPHPIPIKPAPISSSAATTTTASSSSSAATSSVVLITIPTVPIVVEVPVIVMRGLVRQRCVSQQAALARVEVQLELQRGHARRHHAGGRVLEHGGVGDAHGVHAGRGAHHGGPDVEVGEDGVGGLEGADEADRGLDQAQGGQDAVEGGVVGGMGGVCAGGQFLV